MKLPAAFYSNSTSTQPKFHTSAANAYNANKSRVTRHASRVTWLPLMRHLAQPPRTRGPHKRRLRVGGWAADGTRRHALVQGKRGVFGVDGSLVLEICAECHKNAVRHCRQRCSLLLQHTHQCRRSNRRRAASGHRARQLRLRRSGRLCSPAQGHAASQTEPHAMAFDAAQLHPPECPRRRAGSRSI